MFFTRPLHRFVAKTVAVTLLAGVCFHVAMDNALATRAPRPSERRGEEGGEERWGLMPEEEGAEEEGRRGGKKIEEERSGVTNQNEAFKRFLSELETKDAKTRIEEAAQGMEYFMQPKALEADVRLKRVQRPTDPLAASPPPPPPPPSSFS